MVSRLITIGKNVRDPAAGARLRRCRQYCYGLILIASPTLSSLNRIDIKEVFSIG